MAIPPCRAIPPNANKGLNPMANTATQTTAPSSTTRDSAERRAAIIECVNSANLTAGAISNLLSTTAMECTSSSDMTAFYEDIGVLVGLASGKTEASKRVAATIVKPMAAILKRAFGIKINVNKAMVTPWKETRFAESSCDNADYVAQGRDGLEIPYRVTENVRVVSPESALRNLAILAASDIFTVKGSAFGENPYKPNDREKALKVWHAAKDSDDIGKQREARDTINEAFGNSDNETDTESFDTLVSATVAMD